MIVIDRPCVRFRGVPPCMTFAKDHFPVIGVNEGLHECCVMRELGVRWPNFSVFRASRRVDMDFVVSASGVHTTFPMCMFLSDLFFDECDDVASVPLAKMGQ